MSKPRLNIDKRRREKKKKRLARLKREQARSPFDSTVTVDAPPGMEKMSDVLERFVEPYLKDCTGIEEGRKLFGMAVVAWNAALASEEKRKSMVDDLIEEAFPRRSDADRRVARQLLEELIVRKTAYFSTVRRLIVGFELRDTGQSYHLSVISSPPVPPGL